MKTALEISIFNEFGSSLNTREAAKCLSLIIVNSYCQIIELDFDRVEFMSRSFADEFYKSKISLQNELNLSIEILNANDDIIAILRAVSNTQNKKVREFVEVPIYRFSNTYSLTEYLFAF